MKSNDMNRRDFTKLTAAAFGGLVAGSMIGCAGEDEKAKTKVADHACRGLNECKSSKNDCAGQSSCANVKAHSCGEKNDCKNLGGCGSAPGSNACKQKGECAVPMKDEKVWKAARASFEKRMKDKGKSFGDAPAA